jgi:Zn-dependent oligopeptidase
MSVFSGFAKWKNNTNLVNLVLYRAHVTFNIFYYSDKNTKKKTYQNSEIFLDQYFPLLNGCFAAAAVPYSLTLSPRPVRDNPFRHVDITSLSFIFRRSGRTK